MYKSVPSRFREDDIFPYGYLLPLGVVMYLQFHIGGELAVVNGIADIYRGEVNLKSAPN